MLSLPLEPQTTLPEGYHALQAFVCRTPSKAKRDELIAHLAKNDIGSTIGTYSLCSTTNVPGVCPEGKRAFEETIALPFFPEMDPAQIEEVCAVMNLVHASNPPALAEGKNCVPSGSGVILSLPKQEVK